MRNWLVTGGAGFIGSNFVRMVHNCLPDITIVILDALTYAGDMGRLEDIIQSPRIKFIKGDICDPQTVEGIFQRNNIDKVVHFAAESHVDRSILGPHAFIKTNIEGTYVLLEAARKAWSNSDTCLFLHVSTDEVYGSLSPGAHPFTEDSPYRPNSPYSASKASSDQLVRAWYHTYGLPTVISNCSNNYGPWQFPEKLIPLVILNALENREIPVYGDGLQIRDWLHVQDHCEALLAILAHGKIGQTYTIGGNNEKANIELITGICQAVDKLLVRHCSSAEKLIRYVKDRPGHDRRYAIDSSKIQRELGWRPRYDFNTVMIDVVKWYLDNIEWTKRIRSGEYQTYYKNQYGDI